MTDDPRHTQRVRGPDMLVAATNLRLGTTWIDYVLVAFYFVLVLGIGVLARRSVSSSLDFLLSGRSFPAWVTGLAFISSNLGAIELIGMTANGAQYGLPTVHYYWIGAIPAMVFLGIVMMPFYYGSKARSVPEFLQKRFNHTTQRVNAVTFALSSVLIAGVNLFALGLVMEALLGWSLAVAIPVAALVVLSYTFLGGLSAAIYNEVLQFFVILALLVPLTVGGLARVGGWTGLQEKIIAAGNEAELHAWPGTPLTGIDNPFWSVVGIVFGLGFVLSFGYWTTNFAEVQRAMASNSMSAARKTPIIGSFAKMFVPFIVIIPGMVAAVLVKEIGELKAGGTPPGGASGEGVKYNDSLLLLMRDILPNGLLGVAIAGLLAAFMAGMAANISAFNTVFSYDLWQRYIRKDHSDDYYLRIGRLATVGATVIAIFTAIIASSFSNVMDYLQSLFGFFNAPLFATFILGMFWKRMTATAGWVGLSAGTLSAVAVAFLSEDAFGSASLGVLPLSGQGASFVAASTAFVVDIVLSYAASLATEPKPASELRGLVYSETPREDLVDPEEASHPWFQRTLPLAGIALALVLILNFAF